VVVRQRLVRALAVRLALARGEAVADDILVRDLWGDEELARPAARLRVLASRLRGVLGDHAPALRRTAAGFSLDAAPADLVAVEKAMGPLDEARRSGDQARVHAAAAAALAHWRGDPLVDLNDVPFVVAEQRRLESLRLELQLAWIETGLSLNLATVRPELERLTTRHPLHERLVGLSAVALARAGDHQGALSRLDTLRRTLADELGIDPSPETVSLEQRLRQDTSAAAAPVTKVSLPQASKSFVGRGHEYAELLARVARPCAVTLTGGPGVGKTRLAREVATSEQDRGREVNWLDLAPLGESDNLTAALIAALGVDGSGPDPMAICQEALSGALLVIDNAEHLVDAVVRLIEAIHWQTNGISIVVTSQRPLRLTGEEQHRVGPLTAEAGAELFCARSNAEPGPEVNTICAAVDCLPLGIELAAGLTRTLSVSQLAERIDNRLRLLVRGPRDAGLRHTSLRAALDWSHELLEKPARLTLRRLSVFAGGCTLAGAVEVLEDDELPADSIPDLLAELSDRCLLTVETNPGGGRFRLLETVRDYAVDQLQSAGEEDDVRRRHVAWCTDLVKQFDRFGGQGDTFATNPHVSVEEANLLAAVDWCLGPGAEPEKVTAIVAPLWWYWPNRGLVTEASGWLRESLPAVPADSAEYAHGLNTLASLTRYSGAFDEARELGERCLAAFRALGDDAMITVALMALTRTCMAQNNMPATLAHAQEAERRSRVVDNPPARAAALNYMGLAHRNLGRPAEATELFAAALAEWEQINDGGGCSIAWENLSIVARQMGDLSKAREFALRSLWCARESDFPMGLCSALESLGCLAALGNRYEEAVRLLAAAGQHRIRLALPVQVPDENTDLEQAWQEVRSALGPAAYTLAEASRGLPLEPLADEYLT